MNDLTDPNLSDAEKTQEIALRPKSLDEFVGQERVHKQLSLLLSAAKARGVPTDHVLLAGPPGLGKTTLAMIIAEEMGAPIRITSGPAITHAGDLASILSSLTEGEILFIDEIHRFNKSQQDALLPYVEDGTITKIHFPTGQKSTESVEVEKSNLTTIEEVLPEETEVLQPEDVKQDEEKVEPIQIPSVLDPFTGETTKQKIVEHHAPGIYSEHHVDIPVFTETKEIDTKYDYDSELTFKEKK